MWIQQVGSTLDADKKTVGERSPRNAREVPWKARKTNGAGQGRRVPHQEREVSEEKMEETTGGEKKWFSHRVPGRNRKWDNASEFTNRSKE